MYLFKYISLRHDDDRLKLACVCHDDGPLEMSVCVGQTMIDLNISLCGL